MTRTRYLYVANVPLYRVSYIPIGFMVVIQFFGDDQGLRLRRKDLRPRTDYLYAMNVPCLASERHLPFGSKKRTIATRTFDAITV